MGSRRSAKPSLYRARKRETVPLPRPAVQAGDNSVPPGTGDFWQQPQKSPKGPPRRHKLHIPRRGAGRHGSLIPLRLLFPWQTLRWFAMGALQMVSRLPLRAGVSCCGDNSPRDHGRADGFFLQIGSPLLLGSAAALPSTAGADGSTVPQTAAAKRERKGILFETMTTRSRDRAGQTSVLMQAPAREEVFRNVVSKGRFWVLLSLVTYLTPQIFDLAGGSYAERSAAKVPRARGHETNPPPPHPPR